jgi:endoglucanase
VEAMAEVVSGAPHDHTPGSAEPPQEAHCEGAATAGTRPDSPGGNDLAIVGSSGYGRPVLTSRHRQASGYALAATALVLGLTSPFMPAASALDGSSGQGAVARPNLGAPGLVAPARANPSNPLAGREWGVYQGSADPAWDPYVRSSGRTKRRLAEIALRPKAKFFGDWISAGDIAEKVHAYIDSATRGNPRALVQMTLFRVEPWGQDACRRLPSGDERASYKEYVSRFARALGRTHVAVVLQPDGPKAECAPGGSAIYSRLVGYAARRLTRQPNTTVYIEMGSADWFVDKPRRAVKLLIAAGVAKVRGFALDTSHFDSTSRQIDFGTKIVKKLAKKGIPDRHFVIDTSDNGRPFIGKWWTDRHPGRPLGEAQPCARASERRCVTLGIPPTANVDAARWGLSDRRRRLAAEHVDGYLWISRPWLRDQYKEFSLRRALAEVKYWPYR